MEQADLTERLGAKHVAPRVQAISRARLGVALERLWEHRLGLIVGPAGSGKTTLLGQFAAGVHVPTIWYRADVEDGSATALLGGMARGAAACFPGIPTSWSTVDEAVLALERAQSGRGQSGRALLIVDDLHFMERTPAERCLGRLVELLPPSLAVLIASRQPPGFNVSRLRVSGELLEIGPDDLRFRFWEVEDLFRECYREPLSPEDLAALARRTEGWAAGLQLFHLATQGKPARERRQVIRSLGVGSRLVREYLARNVVDDLPPEMTSFLLGTCVLGRLTGTLCDRLLDRTGSEGVLAELERRGVFTAALDDLGTYRYHEVFRSHLETLLVERHGEAEARARFRRAAALLVEEHMLPEALRAYGRAEDWEGAAALLRSRGEEVIDGAAALIDGLPVRLVEHDPWLQLAGARRALAAGQWAAAHAEYRRAEGRFESAVGADICRRERQALTAWLDSQARPPADWTGVVRAAASREPAAARRTGAAIRGTDGVFACALAALLAGQVSDAHRLASTVAEAADVSPLLSIGARITGCAAGLLSGVPELPGELELLARTTEQLGSPWLAGLARALLALTDRPDGASEATRFGAYCQANGDSWGMALASFLEGVGFLRRGRHGLGPLEAAADAFHRLGASVLEAWSRAAAAAASARAGEPSAPDAARQAETLARTAGVPGARAVAFTALATVAGRAGSRDLDAGGDTYRSLADSLARDCGLDLTAVVGTGTAAARTQSSSDSEGDGRVSQRSEAPAPSPAGVGTDASAAKPAPVALRCLGQFSLALHGHPVDCTAVKPRPRSALRLLALHAPRPVHRETLLEALWPGVDPKVGTRNLHVVVSTLRQLLEPGVARGASSLLVREGETYRLDLPARAESDLLAFDAAMATGREARARGDAAHAADAYAAALDLYRGELLPDDGSAEWTTSPRERYRSEAAAAAHALAEIQLAAGKPEAAAATCERGLRVDRYRDSLWRLRIRASDRAGDVAESARVRQLYAEVLSELGLDAEVAGT